MYINAKYCVCKRFEGFEAGKACQYFLGRHTLASITTSCRTSSITSSTSSVVASGAEGNPACGGGAPGACLPMTSWPQDRSAVRPGSSSPPGCCCCCCCRRCSWRAFALSIAGSRRAFSTAGRLPGTSSGVPGPCVRSLWLLCLLSQSWTRLNVPCLGGVAPLALLAPLACPPASCSRCRRRRCCCSGGSVPSRGTGRFRHAMRCGAAGRVEGPGLAAAALAAEAGLALRQASTASASHSPFGGLLSSYLQALEAS